MSTSPQHYAITSSVATGAGLRRMLSTGDMHVLAQPPGRRGTGVALDPHNAAYLTEAWSHLIRQAQDTVWGEAVPRLFRFCSRIAPCVRSGVRGDPRRGANGLLEQEAERGPRLRDAGARSQAEEHLGRFSHARGRGRQVTHGAPPEVNEGAQQ